MVYEPHCQATSKEELRDDGGRQAASLPLNPFGGEGERVWGTAATKVQVLVDGLLWNLDD